VEVLRLPQTAERERGLTLIETVVMIAVIGIVAGLAAALIFQAVNGIRQTNGSVTDVVHGVANDARAAVVYDGSAATFKAATWTENNIQVTTAVSGSVLTISGVDQTTKATYQEQIPLNQEALDPTSGYINH
jgi:type II secretory pathway pseudopilin PulG